MTVFVVYSLKKKLCSAGLLILISFKKSCIRSLLFMPRNGRNKNHGSIYFNPVLLHENKIEQIDFD